MSKKFCSELSKEEIEKVYSSIITKLSQVLLEADGLLIVGSANKKDADYYVEEEVVQQLAELLEKINNRRLAHQHGTLDDISQDVIFLEEHPTFLLRKFLDKLKDV